MIDFISSSCKKSKFDLRGIEKEEVFNELYLNFDGILKDYNFEIKFESYFYQKFKLLLYDFLKDENTKIVKIPDYIYYMNSKITKLKDLGLSKEKIILDIKKSKNNHIKKNAEKFYHNNYKPNYSNIKASQVGNMSDEFGLLDLMNAMKKQKQITDVEYFIIEKKIKGYGIEYVSKFINKSHQTVWANTQNVIKKIKEYCLKNDLNFSDFLSKNEIEIESTKNQMETEDGNS